PVAGDRLEQKRQFRRRSERVGPYLDGSAVVLGRFEKALRLLRVVGVGGEARVPPETDRVERGRAGGEGGDRRGVDLFHDRLLVVADQEGLAEPGGVAG